jgi:ferredoxin-thioredoxin reductase catalytic chain
MEKEKSLEEVFDFLHRTASYYGWKLIDDKEFLNHIAQGLLTNYRNFGFFQCPCRDSWGEREKDRDIMCPCDYCPADIEEYGQCYCGLFLSPEFSAQAEFPSSIPERRPDEKFPY